MSEVKTTSISEQLKYAAKYLYAYELTNHEFLDESELYELKLAQTAIVILQRHPHALDLITRND